MASSDRTTRFDLLKDFGPKAGEGPQDRRILSITPHWIIGVVRLGRPLSFSRRTNKSLGNVKEGAFTRAEDVLIITDDCIQLDIQSSKANHLKTLSATLKRTHVNYMDHDTLLPGDWVMAWLVNNEEDYNSLLDRIERFEPCNEFYDGLKFVGRVHAIRENGSTDPGGRESLSWQLQAVGFEEMDTQFFYDMALATASAVSSDIKIFMAQIGLDFTDWADQNAAKAGNLKDNADYLIPSLINMILGKGVSAEVNVPIQRAGAGTTSFQSGDRRVDPKVDYMVAPQANKEAPYAYLVPRSIGRLLGRDSSLGSKEDNLFGYADIFETLIGVQEYEPQGEADETSMYPEVDLNRSTASRKYTKIKLKGTFLPVNPSFVCRPLWQILQQFLNKSVNEMYTAFKANRVGRIVPTMVVRQIPFSTESAHESKDFPLTRFMSLPRWVVDPVMVSARSLGRSNASRTNMVHVYGEASSYAENDTLTKQLCRNPPIFDQLDIQRSGIHGSMSMVNCAIADQLEAPRAWMEAIADWSFGSQYTLNGTLDCIGVQAPVCEGENIEYNGNVYHVESIAHRCHIEGMRRSWRTVFQLSNGMPANQTGATPDVPVYPGFGSTARTIKEFTDPETGLLRIEASEPVSLGDPEFYTGPIPGDGFDNTSGRKK